MGETPHTLTPKTVSESERRIDQLRDEMSVAVDELSLRGHRMLDWRSQLRRHRGLIAGVAGALVLTAAVAGFIAYRRRRSPVGRLELLARSLRRGWGPSERRGRTKDVAAAGARSAATTAGKGVGRRVVARWLS